MLISGKSHSWVESRNFWVSVETLDFARVCTFTGVIAVGSPAEARRGGGDCRPVPDAVLADARFWLIDQHSGQWRA